MSAETIREQIRILQEYKETTDVAVEAETVNEEILQLESLENGTGEGDTPRYTK